MRVSYSDRRKLNRYLSGKKVDIDPDLAQAYVRYTVSSAPLQKWGKRLTILALVFALLIAIVEAEKPPAEPIMWLIIILAPVAIAWEFRAFRRFERFVSHSTETD